MPTGIRHLLAALGLPAFVRSTIFDVPSMRRARTDGTQAAGLLVGLPIERPLGQRLEYRQAIADMPADFTADAHDGDPDTGRV